MTMEKARRILITTIAIVTIASMAGVAGLFYGGLANEPELETARQRVETLQEEGRQDLARHVGEMSSLRRELVVEQRRGTLLEARRQLALAIDQLDARNFGLAQRHCNGAGARLRSLVHEEVVVAELEGQLSGYQVGAGNNFDESRQQLRGFAATIDGWVAPQTSPSADTTGLDQTPEEDEADHEAG